MNEDDDGEAQDAPCATSSYAKPIVRLPVDVVNRIAAGEIIHRPANALKEMMENSLDAGATMIRVQLRDGGLKLLQIQDDGHGVNVNDLPLLCERFATSKLRSFDDLSKMTTFGFRGEALASISYVTASMTVVSRTNDDETAYKASYASGKLTAPKPGQSASPKPCAGSRGTFITAEDLFFNVPQRRRALKSASEEYNLSLDVISKYAVHFGARGVGFSCKKAGSGAMDLSVPSDAKLSTQDVIAIVYGSKIAKQLVQLGPVRDEELQLTTHAWISNPTWSNGKRPMFLLFINNRLVDSPGLRRALMALYAAVLPKGAHPWIYLSLQIKESNVDVNVHPTKREVHFLHEEEIIETICTYLQDRLTELSVGQTYSLTQSVLRPFDATPPQASTTALGKGAKGYAASLTPGYPQHTVRVDAKMRTLDEMGTFLRSKSEKQPSEATQDAMIAEEEEACASEHDVDMDTDDCVVDVDSSTSLARTAWRPESKTTLESIFELRQSVRQDVHAELMEILRDQTFVGIADPSRALLLLQHTTKLYLVHYDLVVEQLAYQLLLRQFGQFGRMTLQPAPLVRDVVRAALEAEPKDSHQRRLDMCISEEMVVHKVHDTLHTHAEMLSEYFCVGLETEADGQGIRLTSLPNIMSGRSSARNGDERADLLNVERIPTFLLRLTTQVKYSDEKECFDAILRELALLYVPLAQSTEHDDKSNDAAAQKGKRNWTQVWQPAMRQFWPNKQLAKEGAVTSIASLPSLYSIFERC